MSNGKGWILVYRSLQDHWLWNEKPFSKGQAWIDLLFLANHESHKTRVGDQFIECGRGQVNRSYRWLANAWGWSTEKVRRFIKLLEKDGMVTVLRDTSVTVITIENYDCYQFEQKDNETESRQSRDSTETEPRHEREHTKNVKNVKNEKNEKKKADFSSVYADAPKELHEAMRAFEEMRLSMKGTPFTENAFRLIMKKVNKLSDGDLQKSIDILNQSVMNSWKGVFELKESKKKKGDDWIDEIDWSDIERMDATR